MIRLTHIGGPTTLIEIGGRRLLTDPTFDPPGRRYAFGWGGASRKLAGPATAPEQLLPLDAVLLTHDHHADNLDDTGREFLPSAGAVVTTSSGAARIAQRMPLKNLHGLRAGGASCCRALGQACRRSKSRPPPAATDHR